MARTLIAHITDTHIMAEGELLGGRLDSTIRLDQVVARMRALDTRPDCILLTGDLTDRGSPRAYDRLRASLAPLGLPVYAIPGNHDEREAMRQAFRDCDWMPKQTGERIRYQIDLGEFVLFALDSLVPRQDHGELGAAQLAWLAQGLLASAGRRVLIAVHHPPINSGVAVMDAMKLRDAQALGELVARHPNVERILCGHMHRSMHARWQGTVVAIPSATVEQIHLGFDPSAPLGTIAEPPGYHLHYDDPVSGLVTHAVPVGDFAGPYIYT